MNDIALKSNNLAWTWPWTTINPSPPYNWSDFPVNGVPNPDVAEAQMSPNFIKTLKKFYTDTGVIMHFTSAYRSPGYNIQIGGAEESAHVAGKAVDTDSATINGQRVTAFALFDMLAQNACKKAISLTAKLSGFGKYYFDTIVYYSDKGHIHIDMKYDKEEHWKCGTRATRLGISTGGEWYTFCAYKIATKKEPNDWSQGLKMYAQLLGGTLPPEEGSPPPFSDVPLLGAIPAWMWVAAGVSTGAILIALKQRRKRE